MYMKVRKNPAYGKRHRVIFEVDLEEAVGKEEYSKQRLSVIREKSPGPQGEKPFRE
jgi:hypothetical protein